MASVTSTGRRVSLPLFGAPLCASLVLGACNLNATTAPDAGESAGGGAYATSQGSLVGAGEEGGETARDVQPEDMAGCEDSGTWFVCVDTNMKVTFFAPPGEVTYSIKPGAVPCVELKIGAADETVDFSVEIPIAIGGEAEDDAVKCTFRGETSLSVKGAGHCVGSTAQGAMSIAIDQKWGNASATISCVSKRPSGGTTESTVVLGTLGTQQFYIDELVIQHSPKSLCKNYPIPASPVLSGGFSYCLTDMPRTEPMPLVPQVPQGW